LFTIFIIQMFMRLK